MNSNDALINKWDEVLSLCKRRGFMFQNSYLYGGLPGVYDYGPLGIELKRALKDKWWKDYVYGMDQIIGLDSAILGHPTVFDRSGHTATFTDEMMDCLKCQKRFRSDELIQKACPYCHSEQLTTPKAFNLMLETALGSSTESAIKAILRPETAQGVFTNVTNVMQCYSLTLPFGIAQIGKAFRNEITTKHFIFKTREFEQMEIEFFTPEEQSKFWYQFWIDQRMKWWINQGLSPQNLKLKVQPQKELSHYALATTDLAYRFPFGLEEIEGIAHRGQYDLEAHGFKNQPIPHVVESSAGLDRAILALLLEAFTITEKDGKIRKILKLKPHLSPIKVAVMPLLKNKEALKQTAWSIYKQIQSLLIGKIVFEGSGNIGKNYYKHDEIGTPLCITIDFDSIKEENPTATVRMRDTAEQNTVLISKIPIYIQSFFGQYDDC